MLGDSISDAAGEWPYLVETWLGSEWVLLNHAASSQAIIPHLATQVAAAAHDRANLAIIALGTNDIEGGDMGALQAAVEAGLTALAVSNPGATRRWLNVLPRFTAPPGCVDVPRDNIRAAVLAGCTAQGVVCWDTYTVPWILCSDTPDGIHPDLVSGQPKIAVQVEARI